MKTNSRSDSWNWWEATYGGFISPLTLGAFSSPERGCSKHPPRKLLQRWNAWATIQGGRLLNSTLTTTATKLRLSRVPIQPPESQSGNDPEMTTSPHMAITNKQHLHSQRPSHNTATASRQPLNDDSSRNL